MGFRDISGQERAVALLRAALRERHITSYLFTGPEGVGKRTTAITFAKALNCGKGDEDPCDECPTCKRIERLIHPDVRVILPIRKSEDMGGVLKTYALSEIAPPPESAGSISIERIREIKEELAFPPFSARYRVIIILYADQFTREAANSFLKTLEEPGPTTVFILTTTKPYLLPSTIRSRCQRIPFSYLERKTVEEILRAKGIAEAREASLFSDGSLKEAFRFLREYKEFFTPEVWKIFSSTSGGLKDRTLYELSRKSSTDDLYPLLMSLIFLYRYTLYKKLGRGVELPLGRKEIELKAEQLSYEEIMDTLNFLITRLPDLRSHPNPRLFTFLILSQIL